MTEDDFWEIVEGCRAVSGGDFSEQVSLQRERLSRLTVEELLSFREHWDAADDLVFSWPVWDAAALLLDGCGDDSFSDFRAWLVGQGRLALERVAADPDSLADLADGWADSTHRDAELFGMQVFSVYEELTGSCDMPLSERPGAHGPAGESVKISDEVIARSHFPRLAALYYGPADRPE